MFDFAHLSCLFLADNDSKPVKIKQVHYKKLHALGKDSSIGTQDPDKVIFNYSSHTLSYIENNVLVRGLLNFALPPVNCCFEMLQSYQFPTIYWPRLWLRVEIKREAFSSFSSYYNYGVSDELNISKEEHAALIGLPTNKDLIIQKSNKGNSVVLLNRND